MASTSAEQTMNEPTNVSQELKPCPRSSPKPSPKRLCSCIFDCFAFISSFFVFSRANSASVTPISNDQPTNGFEEVAPSLYTCGTSMPMEKPPYDVFINHRGIDVKETLANPLYNTLIGMGFKRA
ncbi:hypothetical protein SUGI_0686320 [Cryptomeria japonica]|nr:hypothetical protein SUGI_0686320 [Cryptomeria japonica]